MARTENIELTVICLIYRENRDFTAEPGQRGLEGLYAAWRPCGGKGNPLWMPLSVK